MVLDPIVRSFDTLDAALGAREALVAGGINPQLVMTQVIQDEAGAVEGNFVVGNGRTASGGKPDAVVGGLDVPYEDNFARTVTRGVHMVMVNVSDSATREHALGILQQMGGIDPQARAARAV